MTINKFQGKTQEEAIAKAKEEFGERAVIMNIREVKPKGLFRAFKNSTFEVTAAMEEKEHFSNAMQAAQMTQSMAKEGKLHDMINLAADEPITIPKLQEQEGNAQATRQESARMPQSQNLVQENEEKKLEERLEVLSDRLEKYLGVKQGSVTPFALMNDTEHAVEFFIDKNLSRCKSMGIHPLENTATVFISFKDLDKFLWNLDVDVVKIKL